MKSNDLVGLCKIISAMIDLLILAISEASFSCIILMMLFVKELASTFVLLNQKPRLIR